MVELAKSKRVYTATLLYSATAVAAGVNIDVHPAGQWVPPGDIKVIGASVEALINMLADCDLSKTTAYMYAELSMLAAMGQVNSIVIARAHLEVAELPTVGEHGLVTDRNRLEQVMFPEGLGMSTNEWHPIFLNVTYRNGFAENLEVAGIGHIYYVEL